MHNQDNALQVFNCLIFDVFKIGFSEAIQRRIQRKKREQLTATPQSVSYVVETNSYVWTIDYALS